MSTWNDDKFYVQFVADYSNQRKLSFSEVKQSLWSTTDKIQDVNCQPVPPFNDVATGFAVEQLAVHTQRPENLLVYVNTAPRKDDQGPRESNDGEGLVLARLENGVPVVSTFAGFTLSFVKPFIQDLYRLDVSTDGSQFRSRDIFPEAVAAVVEGEEENWRDEQISIGKVPERPGLRIAQVDGFGNLKTSIRESELDLQKNSIVKLEIGGRSVEARYVDGIFGVEAGEFAFAPGSSGGSDPYMELVLREGSAEEKIGEVSPGDRIEVDRL